MPSFYHGHLPIRICLVAIFGFLVISCNSQSTQYYRLRITNHGSYPIKSLIVIFPQDRISFGNLPAGATTEYKDVPHGVFQYAAYNFDVDGKLMTQPVIDWVGENPVQGTLFTYIIDFDPSREKTGNRIQLLELKTDN